MKVFLKIHYKNEIETIACCDENLLDRVFTEGNLQIKITNQFFGGTLITMDEAIEILKQASYFNIVGEHIVNEAVSCKILPIEGVRSINGVPMAMKMMF